VRLLSPSSGLFEAAYVDHESNSLCLSIRSEGNLGRPVSRLTLNVSDVYDRLAAAACSYGTPSTMEFLKC
jgi:hypothetical protein